MCKRKMYVLCLVDSRTTVRCVQSRLRFCFDYSGFSINKWIRGFFLSFFFYFNFFSRFNNLNFYFNKNMEIEYCLWFYFVFINIRFTIKEWVAVKETVGGPTHKTLWVSLATITTGIHTVFFILLFCSSHILSSFCEKTINLVILQFQHEHDHFPLLRC